MPCRTSTVGSERLDSDPVDRKGSGVRRYSVHRSVADPNFVMIDLEFDTVAEAEKALEQLRRLWAARAARSCGILGVIVETIESKSL
jgi:hypothetical protein